MQDCFQEYLCRQGSVLTQGSLQWHTTNLVTAEAEREEEWVYCERELLEPYAEKGILE